MPLKLRKRKGSRNWYLRGTVRGISVDESTGTDKKAAAEEIRIKREAELLHRSIYGRGQTATFLEVAVSYMEMVEPAQRRYVSRLLHHFGEVPILQIDQMAAERCVAALYPTAAPATVHRNCLGPLMAILHHAEAVFPDFVAPRISKKRWRLPKGRARWLTPDEAERLIAACSPHMRPLVVFLLYTGARLGEALKLDWSDVDLGCRRTVFRDTKNGETRGVPLHERIVVELGNLPHREGRVFRRPDGARYADRGGMGGGEIKTGFKAACRRAGIQDFTPHDCRHTWATWFYAKHRDIRALMELAGWKSERMVMRYTHVNPDHLAAAINALPWEETGKATKKG